MPSWSVCGKNVPRSEMVFICQIVPIYAIICASIYNLTVASEHTNLWVSLLSSCLGYLMPNPVIKQKKDVLSNPSQ